MNQLEIIANAFSKARSEACPPMRESQDKQAKDLLQRYMNQFAGHLKITVDGQTGPLEPPTLEQCRMAVHDMYEAKVQEMMEYDKKHPMMVRLSTQRKEK